MSALLVFTVSCLLRRWLENWIILLSFSLSFPNLLCPSSRPSLFLENKAFLFVLLEEMISATLTLPGTKHDVYEMSGALEIQRSISLLDRTFFPSFFFRKLLVKTLFPKDPTCLSIGHGEIKLVWTWKLQH